MAETPKRYYPAFLDLDRRLAVVVGEGERMEKRVRQLLRYSADVVVISPFPSEGLLLLEADGRITVERRSYVRGDLSGAFVAYCLGEDEELQRAVFSEAESIGCLANVADAPELCSFILPSVTHRGQMQIAISTGGAAPELAKTARKHIEDELGPEWADWVTLYAGVRALAMENLEDAEARSRVLAQAAEDSVRERLASGEEITSEGLFAELTEGEEGESE